MVWLSLDTNVLVYAVDPDAGERNAAASDLMARAAATNGILTQQVIGEFLNVSRRMTHLDQARLRTIARRLSDTFPILETPRAALFDAFDLSRRHMLQFWDAVIISVCRANDVRYLLTEDMQDGATIDGVTILNPLLASNRERVEAAFA